MTDLVSRWRQHVKGVELELKNAAETPPWFNRMAHELGDYFGFSLRSELRGLVRLLLDDSGPQLRVVDVDALDRALSELRIARTALTYRIGEPAQREIALERLSEVEHRVLAALR